MDWNKFCIYDIKENKDITENVLSIGKSESRFLIRFKNSEKDFEYSFNRIIFIKESVEIDFKDELVFVKGRLLQEIQQIIRFSQFAKVQYHNGYKETILFKDIKFIKDYKNDKRISDIIGYLSEVAELDMDSTNGENEFGFLASQLKGISVRADSVLYTYLNNDTPLSRIDSDPLISPFSSNFSQLQAIKNALKHNISVIQGPPGTGKTQTILNIISNLIIRGKTIAVVSGNNEATRNIYEKLEAEKLGDLCACLGSKANIDSFFSQEHSLENLKETLKAYRLPVTDIELKKLLANVEEIYSSVLRKAELKNKIAELQIEKRVNDAEFDNINKLPLSLTKKASSKELLKSAAFFESISNDGNLRFRDKIKIYLTYGFWANRKIAISNIIDYLQNRYYIEKLSELESQLDTIEKKCDSGYVDESLCKYKKESLSALLHSLYLRYKDLEEKMFTPKGYRSDSSFSTYYPIVLSTTHSLAYCAPKNNLFDYVIIDESSQVNLTSAVLALSTARNVIIVGDSKQLPHIVPEKYKEPLEAIKSKYNLPNFMNYRKYSILDSIIVKFGNNIPSILLNEHYRCDPEIIGFCNKRFYDNNLVIQTEHKSENGIVLIETPSHSANGRTNPRQVEIIRNEILPMHEENIGIIAPYRAQVNLIKNTFADSDILIDTVHKFQGKERSAVILSTTSDRTIVYEDPEHIDFLNNENLINVAISRAKDKLYVIASSEALNQKGTLLGELTEYVKYHTSGMKIEKTTVYSIFDLMYDDYSPILENLKKSKLKISDFESENIIATVIDKICKSGKYGALDYKFNYPLKKIVRTDNLSDPEDKAFVLNTNSHCDFVVFSKLNKSIKFIIEVDGKQHEQSIQKSRDTRKDKILRTAGLDVTRIKTTDVSVEKTILLCFKRSLSK